MYNGPIIDIDLHHRWATEQELVDYVDPQWRDVVARPTSRLHLEAPAVSYNHTSGTNKRVDAMPDNGVPGSSYEKLCEQWLDPFPVERAVLSYDIGNSGGVPNPYLASALCRAANDWSLDLWIDRYKDPRLYNGLLVPTQIPEDGVREIHRLGDHPRMVEALVVSNGMGKPFGHPVYHPIYEAAMEHGLPIAIHNGGDQWNGVTHQSAGGIPGTRFEFHTLAIHASLFHLSSFIVHGVWEKFPALKLMLIEIGIAWLPWLMWTLDDQYAELRRESPWVKRLPSEYLREHVRLSTQPLEVSPRKEHLIELLEAVGGVDDMLMFAADYPHWDTDEPGYAARRLPASWATKVFYDNCYESLRWPADAKTLDELTAGV
jgi:predicted TIM-barrel fold metal-dependent hydrolase